MQTIKKIKKKHLKWNYGGMVKDNEPGVGRVKLVLWKESFCVCV